MRALFIAVFFAACWSSVFAQGGFYEINQACVSEGCFPNDEPGFPVELTKPGSYILTSNLEVDDPDVAAIDIKADNVSLNLNRFTVKGPVTCSGQPVSCEPNGPAVGINGAFRQNTVITNGSVIGFSQWGVVTGPDSFISEVLAKNNVSRGIVARRGTHVFKVKVIDNQGIGLELRGDSVGEQIIAKGNGTGVAVGCAPNEGCNRIIDSSITNNELGIYDWGGTLIKNSVITYNAGRGINNVNGASTYDGVHILFNDSHGVYIGSGISISEPALPVVLRNMRISGNSPDIGKSTGAPAYVDAGSNVCGNSVGC